MNEVNWTVRSQHYGETINSLFVNYLLLLSYKSTLIVELLKCCVKKKETIP